MDFTDKKQVRQFIDENDIRDVATLNKMLKNVSGVFIEQILEAEQEESLRKTAPLFVSQRRKRLSRNMAHVAFQVAYQKIGLEGQVTTHSPRKTYAKMVYENSGNDLLVTQRVLRHTSIEATLYYIETMRDDVTAAMPNFSLGGLNELQKSSNLPPEMKVR